MENLYYKIGRRYYPVHQLTDFCGFPSNGIFVVDQGYTLVVDENHISEHGSEHGIKTAILFHKISSIIDTGISFEANLNNFSKLVHDLDGILNCSIDFDQELFSNDTFYDFYIKKGTCYKKVAETFNSFSTKGIYHVVDGMNNKAVKINLIDRTWPLFINHDDFMNKMLDFLEKNQPLSYYDLAKKASEVIIAINKSS